ncbi:MAG: aminotransferase class V-fold PLP-dependent enzyme [Microthrixaceae bacterium]
MGIPLDQLRADTPGVERVTHFNNAGSALPPDVVVETTIRHLRLEAEIGGYEAAAATEQELGSVYGSLAQLLGARTDQIALIENATRAWDMAVYGFPFRRGDRVLTARSEYATAIALFQLRERHGIESSSSTTTPTGRSRWITWRPNSRRAAMVALTHTPTNSGLLNPAAAVGQLCREHGAFYVLDACQSMGQVPIDVNRIGCDVLSATGRKYLRGPRGTGFLYVSDHAIETLEPPFLDLHSAEWTSPDSFSIRAGARRFETWEANHASRLGLGAAVDYCLAVGVEPIQQRIGLLAERMRGALGDLDGVAVRDKGELTTGIVTFTHSNVDSPEIIVALRAHDINVSLSPVEFAQWDLPNRGVPALVRASVHCYNTEAEVDRLIEVVEATT